MTYRIGFSLFILLLTPVAFSGSDTDTKSAQAKVIIQSALSASKGKDLDFGNAFAGDGTMTVPSTSGAQFNVTGEPGRAFSILLPSNVTMATGGGGTSASQIVVSNFTSSPAGSATLSSGGTSTVSVGATRAALLQNQASGDYSVTFTVVLTYQ